MATSTELDSEHSICRVARLSFPIFVVGMVFVMLVPLPGFALDLLLSLSITAVGTRAPHRVAAAEAG